MDGDLVEYLKNKPTLIEKFKAALDDLKKIGEQEKQEKKFSEYKSILVDEVRRLGDNDKLGDEWDRKLYLEEQEMRIWNARVENINMALREEGVVLDTNNVDLYDFLRKSLEETFTEGDKGERRFSNINGYKFLDKKIIQRGRDKTFHKLENKSFYKFLEEVKKFGISTARSDLINIYGSEDNIKITARELLNETRKQEIDLLEGTKNYIEMEDLKPKIEEIEERIENLKRNKVEGIDKELLKKTLLGRLENLKEKVKENSGVLGAALTSILLSVVSGVATSIPIIDKLKEAGKTLKKVGGAVEKVGKKLKGYGESINNIFSDPVKALGASVSFFGRFLEDIPNLLVIIFLVIIFVGLFLFFINKWRGKY